MKRCAPLHNVVGDSLPWKRHVNGDLKERGVSPSRYPGEESELEGTKKSKGPEAQTWSARANRRMWKGEPTGFADGSNLWFWGKVTRTPAMAVSWAAGKKKGSIS